MPDGKAISPEEANLSIDFLVGFTIFMVAFIFVATMMSGLLINLQSRTIDYDAVAYRTSVVLVEDPGEPYDWQNFNLANAEEKNLLLRLGLSIDRNQPAILHESKIKKFFLAGCSGDALCYPTDYTQKLIFGDYPYNFRISLKELGSDPYSVGGIPPGKSGTVPGKFGYARRAVLIKKPSFAEIPVNHEATESKNINIHMLLRNLKNQVTDLKYKTNLIQEDFSFIIDDFNDRTALASVKLFVLPGHAEVEPSSTSPTIRINGNVYSPSDFPISINSGDTLEILIEQGYLEGAGFNDQSELQLELEFTDNIGYEYSLEFPGDDKISLQTPFSPAVMEVWIW